MSKHMLSIGSDSKPPVVAFGEYLQWKVRMVHFLDNKDENIMKSIKNGLLISYMDLSEQTTANGIVVLASKIKKDPQHYTKTEKQRVLIDKKALTYMLMAIPNELFNRVDSRGSAKELWDELEKHMLGSEKSIQTRMNQCASAYEGFRAHENESILESYNRFNVNLNDLRRNGIQKSMFEINYKCLKNLRSEWYSLVVNLQMNKNMSEEDIHDIYSILYEHEETVRELMTEKEEGG
ncbi:uncharacterized protein LOC112503448 [Cynara cardunculus var. scolymus]|uniref:uncharacterized protein LOC112503448 n=1 Tax=Cynara cardunculus var. scolymus TaxID=59895 RepID=UPI000D62910F|nr:uncharacterized protein LOC112503448 [Cynara cardunculus var. scolymus]